MEQILKAMNKRQKMDTMINVAGPSEYPRYFTFRCSECGKLLLGMVELTTLYVQPCDCQFETFMDDGK